MTDERSGTGKSITRNEAAPPPPLARLAGLLLPSVVVGIGIHVLESGWATFLLYHAFVAWWLTSTRSWRVALSRFRQPVSEYRTARIVTFAGVTAGIAGAGLMWWLWPWYAAHAVSPAPALASLGLHGTTWTLFALYHVLVNPFVEELYWRGALGEQVGIVRPSDVAFAAYHALVLVRFTDAGPIALSMSCLVGIAAFWRWTLRRSGSLWPATVAHAAAAAAIMGVVWLRVAM